jgi:hypothetical protein
MKKHGLPTFPIMDGMDIGEREIEELEWLLLHGCFISSPIGSYFKIEKRGDGGYVLLRGSHERHLVARGEECVLGPLALPQLLQSKRIQPVLTRWQWFGHEEENLDVPL